MKNPTLRLVALLGAGLVLLLQATRAFPLLPHQGRGLLVVIPAMGGVALALAILMPSALRRLLRHPDLLVPIGWFVLVQQLLIRYSS